MSIVGDTEGGGSGSDFDPSALEALIQTNTGDIGINRNDITINTGDIGINRNDIAINTGQIQTNTTNITSNTNLINGLINDNLVSSSTNTYSIDKIKSDLNGSTFFESTNVNDITTKGSVQNVGIGVPTPSKRLEVQGDTEIVGDMKGLTLTSDGVLSMTNSATNASGMTGFRTYPSSTTEVYKRVSGFSHTFTNSNQIFSVEIPDCLFYPNSGFYTKGVGIVKICYSCFGFTDQGQTLSGGIQYREIVMMLRPQSVGLSESVVIDTHEVLKVSTGQQGYTPLNYVVTNPRYTNLQSGISNSGTLIVGTDASFGVDFISQNISIASYKCTLRGTIEVV